MSVAMREGSKVEHNGRAARIIGLDSDPHAGVWIVYADNPDEDAIVSSEDLRVIALATTRSEFYRENARLFVAEASDFQIPPGQWPQAILVDGAEFKFFLAKRSLDGDVECASFTDGRGTFVRLLND